MSEPAVLVDTNVWSTVILPAGKHNQTPELLKWRGLLLGREVVIAAQTEAELLYGAYKASWGATRLLGLRQAIATTPTIPVTADVIEAFARLRTECRFVGHALQAKDHMGDAWIAATGIAHGFPLLTGDSIFGDTPGLTLLEDAS